MMRQPAAAAKGATATLLLGIWLLAALLLYGVHSIQHDDSSSSSNAASVEGSCSATASDRRGIESFENARGHSSVMEDGRGGGCSSDSDYTDGTAAVAAPYSSSLDDMDQRQHDDDDDVITISAREEQQQDEHEVEEEMMLKNMKKLDLHKLVYDIGQGPETTYVYYRKMEDNADDPGESTRIHQTTVPPTSLYMVVEDEASSMVVAADESAETLSAVRLCKFFNLSNRTLHLILKHHRTRGGDDSPQSFELVNKYRPMMASAVACQVGQEFFFLDLASPAEPVTEFVVVPEDHDQGAVLFAHDDFAQHDAANGLASLPLPLYKQYLLFQKTLAFDQVYRNATAGRRYLSNIGRARPVYPLWEAHHVGQTHRVATMNEHEQKTFLTLNVVSTSPRIFKIRNFLSLSEVQHILTMSRGKGMKPSETSSSGEATQHRPIRTRTSQTAWLSHHHSHMLHVIYQRAADVLQIPHDIFRSTVTEDLQVLHYTENAEYKAHYDFGFSPIHHAQQPTRFATLLIYLNDDMEGGETAFPRAVVKQQEPTKMTKNNATSRRTQNATTLILKQKPETGTAILFYSMLPDGNMDERSLHAALPVRKGEKYLCNLWIWDPVVDLVGLH